MIDRLELQNFKCFAKQEFAFRNLTILCGHNAAGKSSVIQSLLIAQQAREFEAGTSGAIPLNGPFGMELGTVADVFCHDANGQSIEISIDANGTSSRLVCNAGDADLEPVPL